jgi:putative transposase
LRRVDFFGLFALQLDARSLEVVEEGVTGMSEVGDVELAVPRDRKGSFTPQLLPNGAPRLGGLDEMIISLYAGGMTLRDTQHHLVSTVGTELSHETISKITDQVAGEVLDWQRGPLEAWRFPLVVANPEARG